MKALLAVLVLATAAGAAAANGPNPITQPPADGCARNPATLAQGLAPPLVYVGGAALPQALTGTVAAAVPPAADGDFGLDVVPDPASSSLLAGDATRLRVAREAAAFPSFAWAEPGDLVQVAGSWVWDCTRWKPAGERTQLHPFRSLWVQRAVAARSPWGEAEGDLFVSTDSTGAGAVADCALQAKGDQAAYAACLPAEAHWQDVSGVYRFVLPAPPGPPGAGVLRARVVDQGSVGGAAPSVVVRGAAAIVTLKLATPPGTALVVAKQVFLGWTKVPATELPQHLRISFRSSLGTATCDAAGAWGPCPARGPIDVYVPRATPWRLAVYAEAGSIVRRFGSPVASLGLHQDRAKGFALTYVVTRVNDALKRAATQPR